MKERKLQTVPVPLPDEGYTDTPDFIRLAEGCARGDGRAMWDMSLHFEQLNSENEHPFFPLAANFWRYFAYLCGDGKAAEWFVNRESEYPGTKIPAVLDESRSGKLIDGGIFRCLGFLHFERGVIYDVYPTGNLGVTYICTHPHRNGTFEAANFAHTYLDEYLNPLPIESVYFHPLSRPDKDALAVHLFPLMRKAVKAAFKRNWKQRENSTYIRVR